VEGPIALWKNAALWKDQLPCVQGEVHLRSEEKRILHAVQWKVHPHFAKRLAPSASHKSSQIETHREGSANCQATTEKGVWSSFNVRRLEASSPQTGKSVVTDRWLLREIAATSFLP
jgi:hypothetical protein